MNEDRIWKHWKGLKKSYAMDGQNTNSNGIWLTLARTHKMRVREVKDIIQARKGATMVPVYCCEEHCFVEKMVEKHV